MLGLDPHCEVGVQQRGHRREGLPVSFASALGRYSVSREVPCSTLKGEMVPDSLHATPKSSPTRRVPSRGTPSVHGILQARIILVLVSIASSRGSSLHRDGTQVYYITGRFFFTIRATTEAQEAHENWSG